MALQKQVTDLPLAVGVETGIDPRVFPTPRFSLLENAFINKQLGKLRKRFGYTELSRAVYNRPTSGTSVDGQVGSARLVATLADELLVAGAALFGFSSAESKWVARSGYIGWSSQLSPILAARISNPGGNVCEADPGRLAVGLSAGVGGRSEQVDFVEQKTNVALFNNSFGIGTSGTTPYIFKTADGTKTITLYNDGGGVGALTTLTHTLASLETYPVVATSANVDALATEQAFAADSFAGGAVYAYRTSTGTLRVGFVNNDGTFGASVVPVVDVGLVGARSPVAVSVSPDGTVFAVLYYRGAPNLRLGYVILDQSLTVLSTGSLDSVARTPLQATVSWSTDSLRLIALWEISGFVVQLAERNRLGAVLVGPTTYLRHTQLAGHIFRVGGDLFFHTLLRSPLSGGNSTQNSLFLFCYGQPALGLFNPESPRGIVGRTLVGEAALPDPLGQRYLAYTFVSETGAHLLFPDQRDILHLVTYEFSGSTANRTASTADTLFLSGPLTWVYRGDPSSTNTFTEVPSLQTQGFLVYPEGIPIPTQAGGGALTLLGAYSYRVYYERTYKNGQRDESTTAAVVNFTLTLANNSITLTIPTLEHTRMPTSTQTRVVVYRTVANGSVFYRHPTTLSADSAVDSRTFLDIVSDATISLNEQDSFAAGELDNVPLPAVSALAFGLDRVWGVDAAEPRRLLFSKLPGQNRSVEFNESLFVQFPEDLVCVGFLSNQVLAWSRNTIYAFSGTGPSNTLVGEFSPVYAISHAVGCSNPRAFAETSVGHVFLSTKGFYLLDRSGSVKYIGQPVEAYTELDFVSAVDLGEENQVRIAASDGTVLTWDYEIDQWSVATGLPGVSGTLWNNKHTLVDSLGTVKTEGTTYFDGTTPVLMRWELGWSKFGSMQGFGRLYRTYLTGQQRTPTRFKLEAGYDYEETYDAPLEYTGDSLPTLEFRPQRQKLDAFRFKFTELYAAGTGQGIELNTVSFEVGRKPYGFRRSQDAGV